MIKLKLWVFILLVGIIHAEGLSINSCVPSKQNGKKCNTNIYITKGSKKGLRVGPDFSLKGMSNLY